MPFKLLKFSWPHAGVLQHYIQALEGADSFAKLKHRGITGHVKLPDFDDAFFRCLSFDVVTCVFAPGETANGQNDMFGAQANNVESSFSAQTSIRTCDDNGLTFKG